MLTFPISLLRRCTHERVTFPQTPVRRTQFGTHPTGEPCSVACLDCGRRFAYELGVGRGAEIRKDARVGVEAEVEAQ